MIFIPQRGEHCSFGWFDRLEARSRARQSRKHFGISRRVLTSQSATPVVMTSNSESMLERFPSFGRLTAREVFTALSRRVEQSVTHWVRDSFP